MDLPEDLRSICDKCHVLLGAPEQLGAIQIFLQGIIGKAIGETS